MTTVNIEIGQDPADWEGVIWTGAAEVHVSQRAVATLLRARDRNSACVACGGELPPTIMGRPLKMNPELSGESVEIVYRDGDRVRFDLVPLA